MLQSSASTNIGVIIGLIIAMDVNASQIMQLIAAVNSTAAFASFIAAAQSYDGFDSSSFGAQVTSYSSFMPASATPTPTASPSSSTAAAGPSQSTLPLVIALSASVAIVLVSLAVALPLLLLKSRRAKATRALATASQDNKAARRKVKVRNKEKFALEMASVVSAFAAHRRREAVAALADQQLRRQQQQKSRAKQEGVHVDIEETKIVSVEVCRRRFRDSSLIQHYCFLQEAAAARERQEDYRFIQADPRLDEYFITFSIHLSGAIIACLALDSGNDNSITLFVFIICASKTFCRSDQT
jgi:hypothetical protein